MAVDSASTREAQLLVDSEDPKYPDEKGDRLKQLRAFCQAARFGSISRGAKQVMATSPAVSTHIRTLEKQLRVVLFKRHGPRITLTPVGERLFELAMPLVQGLDRLPDIFAEQHHGIVADHLLIGAGHISAAYLLPKYLKRFRDRYPEVRIEVRTARGEERLRWLRGYDLDIVVVAAEVPPPDLEFHPVLVSEPILITPLDHPLAGRQSVALEELAGYPFVGNATTGYARQSVESILRQHGYIPEVVVEVDGWDAVTTYVAAGVGISFVPDICLTPHDRFWKISCKDTIPPRRYGVLVRRDGLCSLTTRRFLRILDSEAPEAPGAP